MLQKILGSGIPPQPFIAPGGKVEAGSQDQQGLRGCCDTPTSGLSPAQDPERGQARLAGDRWENSSGRSAWPGSLSAQTTSPLPDSATPLHLPKPD